MTTFSYTPDYAAAKDVKTSARETKFGDGYSQRVAFGINTISEGWSLSFANRDDTEANAIDAFFKAAGGVDPFSWTPPGESTAKKYICKEWRLSKDHPNLNTVTATFSQVFDP